MSDEVRFEVKGFPPLDDLDPRDIHRMGFTGTTADPNGTVTVGLAWMPPVEPMDEARRAMRRLRDTVGIMDGADQAYAIAAAQFAVADQIRQSNERLSALADRVEEVDDALRNVVGGTPTRPWQG